MTFQLFSANFFEILESHFAWQAQYLRCWRVTSVGPHNVNDISYVTRINHASHLSWQAQFFVMLEADSC